MASKFFRTHVQQFEKKGILKFHCDLILQHYNFLKCTIEKNVLICKGLIESDDYQYKYKIEIRCIAGKEPKSTIIEPPHIKPCQEIHMYTDHSLCLHYPPDMKWSGRTEIYRYTIPWVIEWIHFYELYLINGGKWIGRESPVHFQEEDKNLDEDIES